MGNILLFVLAVIPVILICHYIYVKDKRKEPKGLLLKLFLFGFLSACLTILITILLQTIIPFFGLNTKELNGDLLLLFIYVFIGVALIEEFSKFILTYWGAYNNKNFDEIYDGIVYCVYVSLGFACLENVLYVFSMNGPSVLSGVQVALLRGVMAVPGHAFDAIFMGHFFGLAKYYQKKKNKSLEKRNLMYAILVPTLLHGAYDFGLFSENGILVTGVFILVITLYILCIMKVRKISGENKGIIQSSFCPNCGYKVDNTFCPNCGTKQN